jgi:hypothetical protein
MSGATIAVVSSQHGYSVGIGNSGGTYGYSSTLAIGTITPATFKGNTITAVIATSGPSFRLSIEGSHTNLFSRIVIQRTNGVLQTLMIGDAVRSGTTTTSWEWTVADLLWSATSPTPRSFAIYG